MFNTNKQTQTKQNKTKKTMKPALVFQMPTKINIIFFCKKY